MQLQKYKHPFWFYGASVFIPWSCWFVWAWLSHSPYWGSPVTVWSGNVLGLIGLCTPFGVAMIFILPDRVMRRELSFAIFNLKGIPPVYWALTILLFPLSILLAQAISLLFGYSPTQFRIVERMSFSSGIFPAWFLLILAPVLEEFGWHTYGIHCLRCRFNLFATSTLFGAIWGIWHIPLSFVKGYYQNVLVETGVIYSVNFLASLIPYAIIGNWLYYKTGRNMLLVVLFHLLAGYSNEVLQTHPDSKIMQTILLLMFSAVLIRRE
ncbi:MAG: CPBP family intramembrane metalloprotease, partial [Candidatus Accumulibacter sp.]|nr:CPBP family intramembrane metalloprotease [Accumulibacter sp.]